MHTLAYYTATNTCEVIQNIHHMPCLILLTLAGPMLPLKLVLQLAVQLVTQSRVLSKGIIASAVIQCFGTPGDLYRKPDVLLTVLVIPPKPVVTLKGSPSSH